MTAEFEATAWDPSYNEESEVVTRNWTMFRLIPGGGQLGLTLSQDCYASKGSPEFTISVWGNELTEEKMAAIRLALLPWDFVERRTEHGNPSRYSSYMNMWNPAESEDMEKLASAIWGTMASAVRL